MFCTSLLGYKLTTQLIKVVSGSVFLVLLALLVLRPTKVPYLKNRQFFVLKPTNNLVLFWFQSPEDWSCLGRTRLIIEIVTL